MSAQICMWTKLWTDLQLSTAGTGLKTFHICLSTFQQENVKKCEALFSLARIDIGGDIAHDDAGVLIGMQKVFHLADGA